MKKELIMIIMIILVFTIIGILFLGVGYFIGINEQHNKCYESVYHYQDWCVKYNTSLLVSKHNGYPLLTCEGFGNG